MKLEDLSRRFMPWIVAVFVYMACSFSLHTLHAAEKLEEESEKSWLQEHILDHVDYTFRVLSYGIVEDFPQTPVTLGREKTLGLTNYQFETDVRPDFLFEYERLQLSVKPRFNVRWQEWDEGSLDGESEATGEAYVNEWLARVRLTSELFLSYGRENLQWGPSYLVSPSNPFIRDNGKNNPKIEVAGSDFARLVYMPAYEWSISLIGNTEEGEQTLIDGFERAYAIKIDYTGDRKFFSLIPQYRENDQFGTGYYCGWNVSDALILHSEGRVFDGDYELLGGGSYTLAWGPTLTAEYYYDSAGTTLDPIWLAFFPPSPAVSPDMEYFRKDYLLLQFLDTGIRDVLDITLRWICDLDDGSSRTVAMLEYELGDHMRMFTIGSYDSGEKGDEFGFALNYSVFFGVQYTF